MPDPITIEQVQKEYEEHPYATPLEHIDNLLNESDSEEESEEDE